MSEALFILTTIFVAYVVYKTVNEQKATPKSAVPKAKPEATNVVAEQLMPEIVVEKGKPTKIKPATIKKTTPTTTRGTVKKGLRDPKTGEVATTYSNYRFTKRWIKTPWLQKGCWKKSIKITNWMPQLKRQ